jgi:hypothetical protein
MNTMSLKFRVFLMTYAEQKARRKKEYELYVHKSVISEWNSYPFKEFDHLES